MPDKCKTIYQKYRLAAGLTQPEAANLLNVEVRTLAAYEREEIKVNDDLADDMAVAYGDDKLLIDHIRQKRGGRKIIPETTRQSLSCSVLALENDILDFMENDIRELKRIAMDDQVSPDEFEKYLEIEDELFELMGKALNVRISRKSEGEPDD